MTRYDGRVARLERNLPVRLIVVIVAPDGSERRQDGKPWPPAGASLRGYILRISEDDAKL